MNSNATVRNYTDNYAAMLSGIYQEIINEYGNTTRWTNFDLHYWNMDFLKIIQVFFFFFFFFFFHASQKMWQDQGGEAWQLIEPIDGFHPAQIGMTLLAERHLELLKQRAPQLIPPINPNNARIQQLFGDQGGYGSKRK